MRAQPVFEFRPIATRSSVASTEIFTGASVVSICDSPAFSRKAKEEWQVANQDCLGAVRGLGAALAVEGGMGLLIYGIWHLCHLVR